MNVDLSASYRYCEALARREAGNFYPAFRILPRQQRLGMCALYAFMRLADDFSDEEAPLAWKREQLAHWRRGLHGAVAGRFDHESHPALHDTLTRYGIPTRYLEAVLDGVEMDLEIQRYATFADLRLYCYRVASAVGLACIHIWGFHGDRALEYAEAAGLAFQLTNILRDLSEDFRRDRVYLPQEDFQRFGYDETRLSQEVRDDAFRNLMRFEIARARDLYTQGWRLAPLLAPAGRAVFSVMARTYEGLLDVMEARDYDVFSSRVRVSRWKKLWFALSAVPTRLGWS